MNGTETGQLFTQSVIYALPGILFTLTKIFWPYFLPVLILVLIKIALQIYKYQQLKKAGMFEIDRMTGPEFEQFLATLFEKMGYKTKIVGSMASDFGADLVIEKNGECTAVQAKCWHSRVGERAVQEIYGSMNTYHCTKALVVTNNFFTWRAMQLAKTNNVMLWNRTYLAKVILSHTKK